MPTASDPAPASTTSGAPASLTPAELVRALRWRYATKRFDPTARLDDATWSALEQALVLSPSSYGLQPWHFVVVTDAATRAELRAASSDQPQVVECSHLVVFTIRKALGVPHVVRHVERTASVRGLARESLAAFEEKMSAHVRRPPPFDVDEWSKRQLYLALGVFLTSAAVLGVDACPMEGIRPARYDEILGLEARGLATVCAAAVGRRAPDDRHARLAKVRFEAGEVVSHR
jgi:nitroreductase